MRTSLVLALIAGGLACADLHAADKTGDPGQHEKVEFTSAGFAAQREAILERLGTDGYRGLSEQDRDAVRMALARMQTRLDGVSRVEELDPRDQALVFNDQELINTLLTRAAADSRLVCKREKFVGSHRHTQVCLTVGERRRLAEAAQQQLRGLQRGGYVEPDKT